MVKKLRKILYRIVKFLVWLFYPKMKVEGTENLPKEAAIYVGNHSQMNGPIAAELYSPIKRRTWCIAEMMHLKEVPGYAFQDFWSQKPRWQQPFFRVLSYLIAPLAVVIFNNANTIPVYRDMRIRETFRLSMEQLKEGTSLVIYPEHDQKYNHILYDFQDHFIDLAYRYYRKTGVCLKFVPFYIAPALKKIVYGAPVIYNPENPIAAERQRIKEYLMTEITRLAEALPEHRVVPYRNIPKKNYPMNRIAIAEPLPLIQRPVKRPIYDYRQFRLSRLNDPRFSHAKLLGGWLIYFAMYFVTEGLIPAENCHVMHCWVDDVIPFCEYFVMPYYLWYALCFFSLLYFFLFDVDSFKRLQTYIMITQLVAMVCYILYPSRQDLRPEVFPRENFFTWVIQGLYTFDTSTGVCPSLHVAYSLGIGSIWLKYRPEQNSKALTAWKIFLVPFILSICLATAFIKQHSFLDIMAAVPVGFVAEFFTFHVIRFRPVSDQMYKKGITYETLLRPSRWKTAD